MRLEDVCQWGSGSRQTSTVRTMERLCGFALAASCYVGNIGIQENFSWDTRE